MGNYIFTSESVSEGHPDKLADQISDAVLDASLSVDPKSRVACETLVTSGLVVVAGEITSKAQLDIAALARAVIKDVGYDHPDKGMDYKTCAILSTLNEQSPDIAMGVDAPEQGAGDQGLMFGYATQETEQLMPVGVSLAHELVRYLAKLRKEGGIKWLRPDSKAQVSMKYENGKPVSLDSVVLSTQHSPDITQSELKAYVEEKVLRHIIPQKWWNADTRVWINPTGRFVVGGPQGDCGLTGRKIIVDTYGGHGSHGGGAFSGKDPSKVDRSAAYAARHIAKNIVAAGLMDRCLIQLAYSIGVAEPVSVYINDYGTSKMNLEELSRAVRKVWDLKPRAIIEELGLLRPIYSKTAAYGHFGRVDVEFPWEKLDKVEQLCHVLKTSPCLANT